MVEVETDQQFHKKNRKQIQRTDPTSGICGGPVNFGKVFSREGASTMCSPPSISVDDYLATGQTGITLGSTDNEPSGRLDLDCMGVSTSANKEERRLMLTW